MKVLNRGSSPARQRLQAAIAVRDKAATDITNASKAVELQTTELAKANAALEKYADIDSRAASLKATKIKSSVHGGKLPVTGYEAGLRSDRHAKRLAEEAADDERLAYEQLKAELTEAESELAEAITKLGAAKEAVVAEEAAALLEKAIQADNLAAALRGQLLSLDVWISPPGEASRLLLKNSPLLISGWLRDQPATALAASSQANQNAWRQYYNALATNAAATFDFKSTPLPTPPVGVQPLVPAMRYEETPAYAHERGRVARDAPAESGGMMAKPTNSPLG